MAFELKKTIKELSFASYIIGNLIQLPTGKRNATVFTYKRNFIEKDEFEIFMKYRDQIVKKLKKLGYTYVTLDLVGFKSGSMNEELNR